MKQTLIRLLLFVLFALIFLYVVNQPEWILLAFVATYIAEGAITQAITR